MNKKVSIIILTYNGEKYIKSTIDSCLNQTYKNVEVIIIDDYSTDNTVNILKSYAEKIKLYLNEENQGISKNVNQGVSLSNGEYFILLGHDDLLASNHIEVMINEFDANDIVSIHCNSILIDPFGKELKLARNDKKQIQKTNNCLFELSLDNFISSCGMIHRKDIFEKVNGWDGTYKFYGEWLYYIKSLEYGKIKYTDKTKAFYRRHETNITNSFKNKKIKEQLNKYKNECRFLAHSLNNNTLFENFKFYINNTKLFFKSLL